MKFIWQKFDKWIPPPSFMHDKDNNIPASKGDGPLHSMFSVWNEMKMKC